MMTQSLALVSPGRTSSGGSAFAKHLAAELEDITGSPVPQAAVPATGRVSVPAAVASADVVVNLGARVVPTDKFSVFWPLNVAPLDSGLDVLPHTSARNRARHLVLRARLRQSVARADALAFGSHYARSLYMARYAAAARLPYRVIRGGTPSIDVQPNSPDPARAPLVLVCSHLYPYKGILEFIEAFAQALPSLPAGTRCRIAGADRDRTYAAAVRSRVTELNLHGSVTIAAADAGELPGLYAAADLCVFPSTCENAGSFSLYDGLHAGAATICSDRSSMPEVTNGSTFLVNPFDGVSFASALIAVLNDNERLVALRARAVKWSNQAPTWRWRAEELLDFVAEVGR